MKTKEILLALTLMLPGVAVAQDAWLDLTGTPMLLSKSGKNITIGNQGASDQVVLQGGTISFADASGTPAGTLVKAQGLNLVAQEGVRQPGYVPTMAATPVSGTNDLKRGNNAVPTAAANTAACLPASPSDGDTVIVENGMANAVRLKSCGTPGVNGGAAGTYIPLAAWSRAVLRYNGTLVSWFGGSEAVPTPAGP